MTIGGETWHPEELAAVVEAARTLVRVIVLEQVGPVEVAVPTRPHLWRLMEALDAPCDRRDRTDPALLDGVEAA